MPEEKNIEPQKRVSKSFLFSFIIVAAIIGVLVWIMIKNANSAQKFTVTEFVEKMDDKTIKKLDVAEHTTVVDFKGEYVEDNSTNTK